MKFNELTTSTQIILKVILASIILLFFWYIRDILVLLILSLVLASAMEPLVAYFNRRRIPREVSVLTVYVLVISFVALIIYLVTPPVITEYKILQQHIPEFSKSIQNRLGGMVGNFNLSDFFNQVLAEFSTGNSIVSSTFGVFNGALSIITVLVVSFYLIAEQKSMNAFIGTVLPPNQQKFTVTLIEKIQKKMGLWIIGQLIISACIFLITFAGLSLLHVQYALVLALLAGMLEVVPYIGLIVAAVPALLIALTQSPTLLIGTAILYLITHEIEGYILVPKIMQKTVGTSPLAVLLALLVGFKLAGVVGLLLAVPLIGALTVVINEFWNDREVIEAELQ